MKKILSVALSILALTMLTSCGGDAAASPAGKYTLDKVALEAVMKSQMPPETTADALASAVAAFDGSIELKADDTCVLSMTMMGQKKDMAGTWKLDGDKLSITTKKGDADETKELTFADGTITMVEGEGDKKMTMVYKKAAK